MMARAWSILVLALAVALAPLAASGLDQADPRASDLAPCPCCDPSGCEPGAPAPACPSRCPCLPEPARRSTQVTQPAIASRLAPVPRHNTSPRPRQPHPSHDTRSIRADSQATRTCRDAPRDASPSSRQIRLRTGVWLI